MSRNSVLWMQHEESYVHKVEIVHQTEVSCSNGHDTHYMTIKEVYDTYGYKEPLVMAIGVLLRWTNGRLRNCFALIVGKNR